MTQTGEKRSLAATGSGRRQLMSGGQCPRLRRQLVVAEQLAAKRARHKLVTA
jgi:hypothetical protein